MSEWVDRYGPRADDYRLPTSKAEREASAKIIGADGCGLLTNLYVSNSPQWLREVPAVETLRRVWIQQYIYLNGAIHWRDSDSSPPSALMISSPYDTDAHYARKRSTSWVGYKVHLTETCDEERPHLITHVETTDAPASDSAAVGSIHEALEKSNLLPSIQLVDTGYVEAKLLVKVLASMALIYMVRRAATTAGNRKPGADLMRRVFELIGINNKQSAQRVRQV